MANTAKKEPKTPIVPDIIYAQASPISIGGVSLFGSSEPINVKNVEQFHSEESTVQQAIYLLEQAGFKILNISPTMINICGSKSTFETAFRTKIVAEERPAMKRNPEETTATFLDSPDTDILGLISTKGTDFEQVLEGVAIEEPRYFMAPESPFPPSKTYWHLRVPDDVAVATNAHKAHVNGINGYGIKVAMVDTGWYAHPFFTAHGYDVAPVTLGPGTTSPNIDADGHGTGESANIFAVAPGVKLFPVKMSFVNSIGAFNAAVALNPDVITCSWGSSKKFGPLSASDMALAAAISTAVNKGIVVVFSAGNGHWGFPGQHPDVISAGGVYMNNVGNLQASDYSSGFMSNIYPGRRVPDLSGLVGMLPRAAYIMLPVPRGCSIDTGLAGSAHPNGDETLNNDGWAAFSGTSASAPQLAGAVALVKQSCRKLTPARIRSILMSAAKDVTIGASNPNTTGVAGPGPDTATGNGLLDAYKATIKAKLSCIILPIPPIALPTVTTNQNFNGNQNHFDSGAKFTEMDILSIDSMLE